jgi:hypothetical protein
MTSNKLLLTPINMCHIPPHNILKFKYKKKGGNEEHAHIHHILSLRAFPGRADSTHSSTARAGSADRGKKHTLRCSGF